LKYIFGISAVVYPLLEQAKNARGMAIVENRERTLSPDAIRAINWWSSISISGLRQPFATCPLTAESLQGQQRRVGYH
jgi:hypothetical protein